ncbi:hypothetical protein Hypma_002017 [Hypsizygus marmoreus]|uniref:Uncharacterized protein n=1 Tax=Hypsizygus marmoreus TaxID=39966 RepID=A0A369J7A8_HYPMA|nr:hypothetical protein Hypma_002017 [Hypsizygus marmoreus]
MTQRARTYTPNSPGFPLRMAIRRDGAKLTQFSTSRGNLGEEQRPDFSRDSTPAGALHKEDDIQHIVGNPPWLPLQETLHKEDDIQL